MARDCNCHTTPRPVWRGLWSDADELRASLRSTLRNDEADVADEVALPGSSCRTARIKQSPPCAAPVRVPFDPCPPAQRAVDPVRVATSAPPHRATISAAPAIDDDTGDDVDQFVDVPHVMPIGISYGDHYRVSV